MVMYISPWSHFFYTKSELFAIGLHLVQLIIIPLTTHGNAYIVETHKNLLWLNQIQADCVPSICNKAKHSFYCVRLCSHICIHTVVTVSKSIKPRFFHILCEQIAYII